MHVWSHTRMFSAATQCSSTAMVTVVVTDVNDNRPKFTSQSYSGGKNHLIHTSDNQ